MDFIFNYLNTLSTPFQILFLVVGFVVLIKGADYLIDGASAIAQNFKVPKLLIGLTIVAFGTSAPELSVSIADIFSGSAEPGSITLSNVVGSNILNILLLIGIGALIRPIVIKRDTVRKEIPILALITCVFLFVTLDQWLTPGVEQSLITRADGLVLIAVFGIFLYYTISLALKGSKKASAETEKPKWKLLPAFGITLASLVAIVFGSEFVVNSASTIASTIGISERVISLTIVAFGTSLPELITTIAASRRNEQDLLVGNIIGSNIFNMCVVLGIPAALYNGGTAGGIVVTSAPFDLVIMMVTVFLLLLFCATSKKLTRLEGAVFLMVFAAYYSVVIIDAFRNIPAATSSPSSGHSCR